MSRYFKDSYKLSPLQYCNRLRCFDASWLLLAEQIKVSEAAYDVGFKDLSRFNKQFKKHLQAKPSQYRG
jgi:AraC-like DNA-binding protein